MFVVTMFRQGKSQHYFETHSYVLGVFYTLTQAKFAANVECLSRGGKYDAWIDHCIPNSVEDTITKSVGWHEYEYSEEIYNEVSRRYGTLV